MKKIEECDILVESIVVEALNIGWICLEALEGVSGLNTLRTAAEVIALVVEDICVHARVDTHRVARAILDSNVLDDAWTPGLANLGVAVVTALLHAFTLTQYYHSNECKSKE